MKLTPKMTELLKAMANGKRVYFFPYTRRFNPYDCYFSIELGLCTKQARALLSRGLVRLVKTKKCVGLHKLELTYEGRALAAPIDTNQR